MTEVYGLKLNEEISRNFFSYGGSSLKNVKKTKLHIAEAEFPLIVFE